MAAESTLSPPAPLDLGRMEMEAKETAKKHIANILQVQPTCVNQVFRVINFMFSGCCRIHTFSYFNNMFNFLLDRFCEIKYPKLTYMSNCLYIRNAKI